MKAVFSHGQLQLHLETVVLVGIISPVTPINRDVWDDKFYDMRFCAFETVASV